MSEYRGTLPGGVVAGTVNATPTSSAQVADGMNLEAARAEFEAYIGWNAGCQFRNADCSYQVSDLQHAWEIWQAARRAAPVAEGVALPPLPLERIIERADENEFEDPETGRIGFDRLGFAQSIERDVIAPYAERIRQLESELATFKGEHATRLATKSIEEDARFQCLLYHYVVARQKLADGRISEKEATDAFRELIARIDGRTAGPAVPQVCNWVVNEDEGYWHTDCGRDWVLIDGTPAENKMDFCHGCGKQIAAAPKPQEDA